MINKEQRNFQRTPVSEGHAEVEIDHTYGKIDKSIYRVIEYGEFGLSFLVPFEDGYFLVGTPVKFTIVHTSIKFRRMFTGIVKYYHPVFLDDGKKYYKTGVSIVSTYRDLQNKKLHIRPERLIPSERSSHYVRLTIDSCSYEFAIADVSKYSAAFFCDESDLIHFNISSTIQVETISIDNLSIYSGTATIIRVYRDNQSKSRVVFQPQNELINVTSLSLQKAIRTACSEINEAIVLQVQYADIDSRFKTAVADLRVFLENIRKILDTPGYQVPESETSTLLNQIFPDFFMSMDSQVMILDDIIRELYLSHENHLIYKNYFQRNLLHLFLQSPLNHICYFKPNGYPGDFEMMRLTHINSFHGPTLFAKILSKYSTSCHLGETGRARTEYLHNFLYNYLKDRQEEPINIFSIASGPALEIQDLVSQHPEVTNNVTFTLLDQEIKALQYSMDSIYDKKIRNKSNINVTFIHDNLQNYLREISQKEIKPRFDIIYSFGLFDYFDKSLGRFVLNSIKPLVKPGGKIIIANASLDNNKNRVLMEYVFDWYLVYRDTQEMKELSKDNFDINNISIDEIENGTMKFLIISL